MASPAVSLSNSDQSKRAAGAGSADGLSRTGGALLVLATAAVLLAIGAPKLLNDPDTLWHVRVGLDISATGVFPRTDAYSHTFAGEPWIAKEWLSQVILAAAYGAAGWNGVAALAVFALLSSIGLVHRYLSAHLRPAAAAIVAIWGFALCSGVFLARPHVVVLPIIILFIGGVWRRAEDARAPAFWLLSVLCLWANLHGSFTFGFLAAGLAFLRYLDAAGLWTVNSLTPASLMKIAGQPNTRAWLLFLLTCPLVTLIHPYGVDAIWSTLIVAKSEALPYIREWRPFSAQTDQFVALNLVAAAIALMVSGFRTRPASAIFVGLLVYLYLTHVRFVHFLFLLAPIVLARDLAVAFPSVLGGAASPRPAASQRRRALRTGIILAGAAAVLAPLRPLAPPRTAFPANALAAANAADLKGPVYNGYSFGGALLFAGVPTFIDGRTDRLYNGGFVEAVERSKKAGGGSVIVEHLETYKIGWTLLRQGDPRIIWFEDHPNWMRFYHDETAVIHVPSRPREALAE
ncbi:MAG: hypothetical protein AAF224_13880 [Pseudomonadota bacterium]